LLIKKFNKDKKNITIFILSLRKAVFSAFILITLIFIVFFCVVVFVVKIIYGIKIVFIF